MEATGSYYQRLAIYLHEKGIRVSVVNPLIIKRFIQMKLHHNKNDKADAQMICRYACEQRQKEWHPEPLYIEQSKILYASIELYFKQSTANKEINDGKQPRDTTQQSRKVPAPEKVEL